MAHTQKKVANKFPISVCIHMWVGEGHSNCFACPPMYANAGTLANSVDEFSDVHLISL